MATSTNGANPIAVQRTMTGHVGHLSPSEESTLAAFKKLCSEQGLYNAAGADGDFTARASHDDGTLV